MKKTERRKPLNITAPQGAISLIRQDESHFLRKEKISPCEGVESEPQARLEAPCPHLRASEIRTSVRVILPLRGSDIEGLSPFSTGPRNPPIYREGALSAEEEVQVLHLSAPLRGSNVQ